MKRPFFLQLPLPETRLRAESPIEPLGAAILSLAAARGSRPVFLPREFVQGAGDAALLRAIVDAGPDLVGFSTAVWNIRRTLWMAGAVRRLLPEASVFLGGPEIAYDNELVLANESMTAAFPGEGEPVVAELAAGRKAEAFAGAILPGGRRSTGSFVPPPVSDLDAVPDPYRGGVLPLGPARRMYLETARGCRYGCKFCSYGMGRDTTTFRSAESITESFRWAREHGVREVYLLDPSIDQRPDLAAFLAILARVNSRPAIPLTAELRAEGMTRRTARLLARAGVREVEVGLQTTSRRALALLGRGGSPEAALAGAALLREAGIRVRLDLVLGLPGETEESWRRTVDLVAAAPAWDDFGLFMLSVLPGTPFRAEAAALGLRYSPEPPYHVAGTAELDLDTLRRLYVETADRLGIDLSPDLRPGFEDPGEHGSRECLQGEAGLVAQYVIDLDRGAPATVDFSRAAGAVCLWFRGKDLWERRAELARILTAFLEQNPFATTLVVLEPGVVFPLDLCRLVVSVLDARTPSYLAGFYAPDGDDDPASRLSVVLPLAAGARVEGSYLAAVRRYADVLWQARPLDERAALAAAAGAFPAEPDFLLLHLGTAGSGGRALARRCLAAAADPERICFTPRSIAGEPDRRTGRRGAEEDLPDFS